MHGGGLRQSVGSSIRCSRHAVAPPASASLCMAQPLRLCLLESAHCCRQDMCGHVLARMYAYSAFAAQLLGSAGSLCGTALCVGRQVGRCRFRLLSPACAHWCPQPSRLMHLLLLLLQLLPLAATACRPGGAAVAASPSGVLAPLDLCLVLLSSAPRPPAPVCSHPHHPQQGELADFQHLDLNDVEPPAAAPKPQAMPASPAAQATAPAPVHAPAAVSPDVPRPPATTRSACSCAALRRLNKLLKLLMALLRMYAACAACNLGTCAFIEH